MRTDPGQLQSLTSKSGGRHGKKNAAMSGRSCIRQRRAPDLTAMRPGCSRKRRHRPRRAGQDCRQKRFATVFGCDHNDPVQLADRRWCGICCCSNRFYYLVYSAGTVDPAAHRKRAGDGRFTNGQATCTGQPRHNITRATQSAGSVIRAFGQGKAVPIRRTPRFIATRQLAEPDGPSAVTTGISATTV